MQVIPMKRQSTLDTGPRPSIVQLIVSRFFNRRPKFAIKSDLENREHPNDIVASRVSSKRCNFPNEGCDFSAKTWSLAYCGPVSNDSRPYIACPAVSFVGFFPVHLFHLKILTKISGF